MKKVLLIALALSFFTNFNNAFAEKKDPMSELINSDVVINVYVADVKNSSGDDKIDLNALKMRLEQILADRMPRKFDFSGATPTKKFKIAKHVEDADIIINSVIIEYLWTDDDPIDMITGLPGIAYDALTKENYARMQILFTINNARRGTLLWEDTIRSTITDKDMTEEESYGRTEERIIKMFMKELFERPDKPNA